MSEFRQLPFNELPPYSSRFKCRSVILLTVALTGVSAPAAWADGDLDVGGRIMVDYSTFDGLHNDDVRGDDWYVRRARMYLKHDSERGWEGELTVDFDPESGETDIKDALLEYTLSSSTKLFFGKTKEPFGLLNSTSSNDIIMLERSAASEIFSPGRSYGIGLEYETDHFHNNIGLYQASRDDEGKSHYAVTLRSAYSPIDTDSTTVHFGLSATQRELGGDNYEVNDPIEVPVGDKFVESRDYDLDALTTVAYEAALIYKRFSLQSEVFQQSLDPTDADSTVKYDGYHAYASLFLTNHRQQYKNGSFDGFSQHDKEHGFEITAGISEVNLVHNSVGMIANSVSLSLNYYLSNDVRLILHTAKVDLDSSVPEEVGTADSTSLRLIYQFD